MPEKERVFTPSRGYDLQLKIKDLDYTGDLMSATIVSSLSTAYQVIVLELLLDPNDIILEDIFGKDSFKLSIKLMGQDAIPHESIDFDLMFISSEFKTTEKRQMSEGQQKDRSPISISTICRTPFKTMNTLVNEVYIGTTIREIINDLSGKVGTEIEYDSDGENTEIIDQVCIPPTTLYKIIKEYNQNSSDTFNGYLDQRFGLFNGVPGVFCQYDGKIYIKNLTKKLDKSQTFTIYQLSEGSNSQDIMEKSLNGDVFYTYDPVSTDFSGNAKFAIIAPVLKHIVKPKDTLSYTIEQKLSDVIANNSCAYQNKNVEVDLAISSSTRIKYYNEDTGNEKLETQFNSRIGRQVSDLATVSINIEKNLPIMNLMNVGECIMFSPQILEYVELGGKYILWSSSINFIRSGEWGCTCTVNLIRSNRKI